MRRVCGTDLMTPLVGVMAIQALVGCSESPSSRDDQATLAISGPHTELVDIVSPGSTDHNSISIEVDADNNLVVRVYHTTKIDPVASLYVTGGGDVQGFDIFPTEISGSPFPDARLVDRDGNGLYDSWSYVNENGTRTRLLLNETCFLDCIHSSMSTNED